MQQLLSFLFLPSVLATLRGSPLAATRQLSESIDESSTVLCRLVAVDTMYEDEPDIFAVSSEEVAGCVPVVDGLETDEIIELSFLPATIAVPEDGETTAYVKITAAALSDDGADISVSPSSEYIITERPSPVANRRNLQQQSITTGTLTVAVVRIATSDKKPSFSHADVDEMFNAAAINFSTQFNKCSRGNLKFVKHHTNGIIDVTINQPIANFGTRGGGKLVTAVQNQIKATTPGLASVADLADKVLMCVPAGTGSWVASAGMNHFRAQFNDQWCTSLTAVMHELGHSIGLLHSNEKGEKYADRTGYMTKAVRSKTTPQRCFNGQNHHHLRWFTNKESRIEPTTAARQVNVAAFVDHATAKHPILIDVGGEFYLQYNRAKSYNMGTGEMANTVTVVTKPINGGSQLEAGLKAGDVYTSANFRGTGQTLRIENCRAMQGQTAETIILSIGLGSSSICANAQDTASGPPPTAPPPTPRPPTVPPPTAPLPTPRPPTVPPPTVALPTPRPPTVPPPTVALPTPRPPTASPPVAAPTVISTWQTRPTTSGASTTGGMKPAFAGSGGHGVVPPAPTAAAASTNNWRPTTTTGIKPAFAGSGGHGVVPPAPTRAPPPPTRPPPTRAPPTPPAPTRASTSGTNWILTWINRRQRRSVTVPAAPQEEEEEEEEEEDFVQQAQEHNP